MMGQEILLSTKRLTLKGVTPAAIHELFRTKNQAEISKLLGLLDSEFASFKEMHEKGMETYHLSLFFFLLVDKESNIPIGRCGFHTWNTKHKRAELFYLLTDDALKNKGLMSEALPEVLRFGFACLDLHRVEALVAPENKPSIRLLLNNHFVKEGTMREDYCVNGVNESSDCYSLLKGEWETSIGEISLIANINNK